MTRTTIDLGDPGWRGALSRNASLRLFASDDLEETRTRVGGVMKPHALGVVGGRQRLRARMHHAAFGDTSISRLGYGACVSITPDTLDDFFLVQMPISGVASIASGDETIDSTPRLASVLSPTEPIRMRWAAESDQLLVRIPRTTLERAHAAQLGRAPGDTGRRREPLRFALGLDWQASPAWRNLTTYLLACADEGVDAARHPLLASRIDQLVVGTLLAVQPHNFSAAPPPRCAEVLPRHVRRVEDHLHAHADEPIAPADLARLAGVSLRSLYAGFRRYRGIGPMECLKRVRLDRARADLLDRAPGGGTTVADVALRWGFGHLGRFAADYRARFGEPPSRTLRGG